MPRQCMISNLSFCILIALCAFFWGFTPFSKINNVCPKCLVQKSDLVVLRSGISILCNVLAQNRDFYVIRRFGELRAVMKTEVTSVELRDNKTQLTIGDQILLKNGVALHGAIVEESRGRFLVIQVESRRHVAWVSQIESVFKGGELYNFE